MSDEKRQFQYGEAGDEMFSQETEDVGHSIYDSMDVPENTAGRSEGKNLWLWDLRARWGLVRERCET